MQIGDALHDLFLHMEWADAMVWTSVRKLGGDEDRRLTDLLSHLHLTQRAFLDVWLGKGFDRGYLKQRGLREAEDLGRDYHREAAAFVATVDASSLDRPTSLPWAGRFADSARSTTLGETMLQITSHSTYHRGQANMRIRELGSEPNLVDYIAWLWLGRPPATWP
jgi:uncharacterized damage-inducible protein DinB